MIAARAQALDLKTRLRQVLGLFCACLWLASPLRAEGITVFAAASLKDALEEIGTEFEASGGGPVTFSFAGSSVLARQIGLGAPADIFISASEMWMDSLEAQGAIVPDSRFNLAGNSLVLVTADPDLPDVTFSEGLDLSVLLGDGRLAMGLVQAVPAGIYGKQALDYFGLWNEVADKVAQSDNVRASLAFVAMAEARLGIVYASDARAEPRVRVIAEIPADSHDPILYPAALTTRSSTLATQDFLDALSTPDARAVLARHGFIVFAR
jgi:molybdate transport system substrate-binding protein